MLIRIYVLVLIAIVDIVAVNNSPETDIRSYFIKKDSSNVFKLGEFSIFDSSQNHLFYRIKSYYAVGGELKLIDVSSNKAIGQLKNAITLSSFEANFSIFDSSSDQWINGKIERMYRTLAKKYIIKWNRQSIFMETKLFSSTTTFEHEYHSGVLAKIQKRSFSLMQPNRYDLQIFSDDLPAAFYFLALAVKDQNDSVGWKG